MILLWRRVLALRFSSEQSQAQFLGDLQDHLDAGDFNGAAQMCETDERALPQLALAAIENRELGESQLRQLIAELMQRNILADLESRLSWVATVIKSGPLLGIVRHGAGHDGGLRTHRHRRESQAGTDRLRHQHRLDLHGDGPDDRHPVHLHAGQPEHPRADVAGFAEFGHDPLPGAFQGRGGAAPGARPLRRTEMDAGPSPVSNAPPSPFEENVLVPAKPLVDDARFDVTAMVDLVFMMNIFFLVTWVEMALAEIDLPTARHCAAADKEESVVLTITKGPRRVSGRCPAPAASSAPARSTSG